MHPDFRLSDECGKDDQLLSEKLTISMLFFMGTMREPQERIARGYFVLLLQRCRELLESNSPVTDEELELLRDQLYALADIAITVFLQRRGGPCRKEEAWA